MIRGLTPATGQAPHADGTERFDGDCLISSWTRFNSLRQYVRTAKQIHEDDMKRWSYRWRYYLGWPKNQLEILWLKYKPKGKWVPVDAQSSDEGDQTSR